MSKQLEFAQENLLIFSFGAYMPPLINHWQLTTSSYKSGNDGPHEPCPAGGKHQIKMEAHWPLSRQALLSGNVIFGL